ncbi:MAG TPA: alpha/beta hydrolase [Candidatus Merdenecus merdavium]|nr:alpha/beta hydrolase [Candidatus Merdenecus merdavium]
MRVIEFQPLDHKEAQVTGYLRTIIKEQQNRKKCYPAIVICPGGGYEMVSEREAEPVAYEYMAAGYHVFILRYSIRPKAGDFRPLMELANTVEKIRKNAREWKVDPDCIAVCGFSAGGHLAASLGTLAHNEAFIKAYGKNHGFYPNAMVLSYPVITADEYAHIGSIENASGNKKGTEEYKFFGLDHHVTKDTCPVFLWHTSEDDCVPVENSLAMARALSKEKIPYELHVFPHGGHGMSVCTEEVGVKSPYNQRWMKWSIEWLNQLFGYQK